METLALANVQLRPGGCFVLSVHQDVLTLTFVELNQTLRDPFLFVLLRSDACRRRASTPGPGRV